MAEVNKRGLANVVLWTYSSEGGAEQLSAYLDELEQEDLLELMSFEDYVPAHIGWSEYGRRRGFVETFAYEQRQDGEDTVLHLPGGPISMKYRSPLIEEQAA